MKKISFMTKSLLDGSDIIGPVPLDDKYTLLSYFIDDTKYNVQETIQELEQVYKGEKTFEEMLEEEEYAGWGIADGIGTFECDNDSAYFIADEDSSIPSMEMPLKELMDILYEWKAFLGE